MVAWHSRWLLRQRTCCLFFFFNDTATTEIYTLSLHDALPILRPQQHRRQCQRDHPHGRQRGPCQRDRGQLRDRSEEHTSELQSPCNLVCRLLLEKKKKKPCIRHIIFTAPIQVIDFAHPQRASE